MTTNEPIIMTIMVRDEADIIAAMIEHHIVQGIDHFIVTDNGSVDGTREILADYAAKGIVELRDDPRHVKQQAEVVTRMARDAYATYGAAWVINADADEFWVADSGTTVAAALRSIDPQVQSFNVPVRNMFGAPLSVGSAIRNNVWRDERDLASLNGVGLHDHPTADCVHRGAADVKIAQGNHFTNLPLTAEQDVPVAARLSVLHFPYRTWEQYRHRVIVTAEGYRASDKQPSPRHHVMRDAAWLELDELLPVHVARHPDLQASSSPAGFAFDTRIRDELESLRDNGTALIPERLDETLTDPVPLDDEPAQREEFGRVGRYLIQAAEAKAASKYHEHDFFVQLGARQDAEAQLEAARADLERVSAERDSAVARLQGANRTIDDLNAYIARFSQHPVTKAAMLAFTPVAGQRKHALGRAKDAALAPLRKLRNVVGRGK